MATMRPCGIDKNDLTKVQRTALQVYDLQMKQTKLLNYFS